MNGNPSSETLLKKTWIEGTREALDNWEVKLGLPSFSPPKSKNEAFKYLDNTVEDRQKMTPEECADAVIALAHFSAYVTRACQREESEALLLKEQINKLIGEEIPLQKAYSPEERRSLAMADNEKAKELESLRIASSIKSKRLFMYADKIDKIAKAYETLSYSRKRNRQYGE